ncbi:MAG TPA: PSD1 and planctomycete cytochrome C domain-containing protein [Planctomycetota bacterium]|nr:PSD1 and planctomycete cytochrome C domain-containing protein [Planctomycetota bacterium]
MIIPLALLLTAPAQIDSSSVDFFESKIRPVLETSCFRCHSARSEKLRGGLRLDSREGWQRGGERGPVIVPGRPEESLLLRAIRRVDPKLEMPPDRPLSPQVVADFAAWIAGGAPDPRAAGTAATTPRDAASSESAASAAGPSPGGIDPAKRAHWAFVPVRSPALPAVERAEWCRTPIDRFILARLEEKKLTPAPEADPRTLLRRATYDLTGLPPAVEEVERFAADESPGAYEREVERLLASPRYGERWGRYWLDVARYADTKGYVYGDREERRFLHSALYRDWVIRAFNEDLPYDRFILLQLAADQAGAGRDLAAMGFITLGRRFLGVIHDIIDDRIDTISRGLLGLTVACARCHDHKFDPITTKEYYGLYGVLQGSTERTICLDPSPQPTPELATYETELAKREAALDAKFREKKESLVERLRSRAADYLAAVLNVESLPSEEFYSFLTPDDLNPVIVRQWQAYIFHASRSGSSVFAAWDALRSAPAADFAAECARIVTQLEGRLHPHVAAALRERPPSSVEESARRLGEVLTAAHVRWRAAIDEARKCGAPIPEKLPDPLDEELRQVLYGPDSPAQVPAGPVTEVEWFFDEPSRVELGKLSASIEALRIESAGAPPYAVALVDRPVQRNTRVFVRGDPRHKGEEAPREFLAALSSTPPAPFEHGSGRLELAQAIASPGNPLTARVLVNRIWLHHFGTGLVRTPSDFGLRAEPPSHPELLDFLALRFVESGWSIKAIHRLILLSSAYRQSSEPSPEALHVDPDNRLLAHRTRGRLDFEALRDTLVAASGDLDLAVGGKPVEILAAAPPTGRRTVYGLVDRQFLPGTFRVFDFANPDQHTPERHLTTVPQQALFLLNSPFLVERARAIVRRLERESVAATDARVRRLYGILFARAPSDREEAAARRFIAAEEAERKKDGGTAPPSAWAYGYGEYVPAERRLKTFAPLPYFEGDAWQGGPSWPDATLGWARLTADGGHVGNDLAHAVVRRWTAPRDGALSIEGELVHEHAEGDGIRAHIISSRDGELGVWSVHNGRAAASIARIAVRAGDTIDFVAELGGALQSDDFRWAPRLRAESSADLWSAKDEFGGPRREPLTPWQLYAQSLLLTNELVFID